MASVDYWLRLIRHQFAKVISMHVGVSKHGMGDNRFIQVHIILMQHLTRHV